MTLAAHAKWFVDEAEAFRADWDVVASAPTLAFMAGAVVLAAGSTFVSGRRSIAPAPLHTLRRHVPRLLGGSVGLSLVLLAADSRFLSPAVTVDGVVLPVLELGVGLWLIAGAWRRAAAMALGGLLVTLAVLGGPVATVENAVLGGVVLFLTLPRDGTGAAALRVALGASLVAAAFTEKLAAPGLTEAVFQAYPPLDTLADPPVVRLAGAAELLLGLLLISGAAVQLVALGALVPFAASVVVFGVPDLVGHLPIYGALAALAILASRSPAAAPALRAATGRGRTVVAGVPSDSHT